MPDRATNAVGFGKVPVADIVEAPPVYDGAQVVVELVVLYQNNE